MGQIVSKLVCIYCQSGCQGSVVASLLAFHPPQPYYELFFSEDKQCYEIIYCQEIEDALAGNIPLREIVSTAKVDVIKMSPTTSIPVIHLCGVPEDQKSSYTILFSHGNATDMGAMIIMYAMIAYRLRVNVIGYDYSGYGPNMLHGGQFPMEKQTYKDILAVYDWILQKRIVTKPGSELVLYGQSIGSGPTVYLSSLASHPVAGAILHSPIMSGLRVLTPSRILCCCDIYPNIDRIKRVTVPVLIMHGMEDAEVHIDHGKRLYAALPEAAKHPPWWVPRRGHNDIVNGNEKEFMKRLAFFLHCTTLTHTRRKVAPLSPTNSYSFSFTSSGSDGSKNATNNNTNNNSSKKTYSNGAAIGSERVSGRMIGRLAEGLADDVSDEEERGGGGNVAMAEMNKSKKGDQKDDNCNSINSNVGNNSNNKYALTVSSEDAMGGN